MAEEQIVLGYGVTYNSIFQNEVRQFFRKVIWGLIILSGVLGWGLSTYVLFFRGWDFYWFTFLVFLLNCGVYVYFIVSQSKALFHTKKKDNYCILISKEEIEVLWPYRQEREVRAWEWIERVEYKKNRYFLFSKDLLQNAIIIDPSHMNSETKVVFEGWLEERGLI